MNDNPGVFKGVNVTAREAAGNYTSMGISVVPIVRDKKIIDRSLLESDALSGAGSYRQYMSRIAPADTLDFWFRDSTTNLGILGGFNDTLILDFDSHEAYERWRQRFSLLAESTPTQRTRNGYHVFLRLKPGFPFNWLWKTNYLFSNFQIDPGKDDPFVGQIIWKGCHVVAWPSRVDGNSSYRWVEGQSPVDLKFVKVRSLKKVGIFTSSALRRNCVSFMVNCIRDPARNLAYLTIIFLRMAGRKDTEFRELHRDIKSRLNIFKRPGSD